MIKLSKPLISPSRIYGWSIFAFLVFTFIGIPLLSRGHSGGEQVPLTLLADQLLYSTYYFLFLSILTTILYWEWFKRTWYINVAIFVLTSFFVIVSFLTP
jgi:hypothetical protein